MCSATDLKKAAYKLRNATERKNVLGIAKRMAKGRAQEQEIAWAKRITLGVRETIRPTSQSHA